MDPLGWAIDWEQGRLVGGRVVVIPIPLCSFADAIGISQQSTVHGIMGSE